MSQVTETLVSRAFAMSHGRTIYKCASIYARASSIHMHACEREYKPSATELITLVFAIRKPPSDVRNHAELPQYSKWTSRRFPILASIDLSCRNSLAVVDECLEMFETYTRDRNEGNILFHQRMQTGWLLWECNYYRNVYLEFILLVK